MLISIDEGEARLLVELLRKAQDEEIVKLAYEEARRKHGAKDSRATMINQLIRRITPNL